MRSDELLAPTPAGLYCPAGDFYIDPIRSVDRAVITHGHSDHARAGHSVVLATPETLAIMAVRHGHGFAGSVQPAALGEPIRTGGVTVTLFPAGHVLGSAQVLVEYKGLRVVVSGDYKRQEDPTASPFEPIPCEVFVTEATFGLPVFRHPDAAGEVRKLLGSLELFPERPHIVGAYALGKAQRLIALLRRAGYERPIYLHGALSKLCALYEAEGIPLGVLLPAYAEDRKRMGGEIVLCPPSSTTDLWARRFNEPVACFASGWMRVRQRARQRGVELPLVVSDHADWDDLCRTIKETGAGELWVTHGQEDALVHWALTGGLPARPLGLIGYDDEEEAGAADVAGEEQPNVRPA